MPATIPADLPMTAKGTALSGNVSVGVDERHGGDNDEIAPERAPRRGVMRTGLHAIGRSLQAITIVVLGTGFAIVLGYALLVFVIIAVQGVAGIGGQ
jgi:hypothetical protein